MKHDRQKQKVVCPLNKEADRTVKIIICIFLVVSISAVYWQIQDHEFINHYDDRDYVTDNLNVKSGLTSKSVKWAFTTFHFQNWHPITWLSHMLDCQLYGLNPKGHFLTNLIFHIVNALILFMVLFRMTGGLWQSGFVAAIFALHPLNVESVAWVAERKNILSTFFWLLTMWAYIFYIEKSNIRRYGLVVIFFALGLMSKPMLVTLPFVLLLMDYWPLKRMKLLQANNTNGVIGEYIDKKLEILWLVFEKIPLFLLAAGSCVVTFLAQKSTETVKSEVIFPLDVRIVNAMVSYLEYLEKTVWPKGLAVFYPHPGSALAAWKGILCGVALLSIIVIASRLIKKVPYFAVGWFWYLGTLVPVIGVVQGYKWTHGMADRHLYIPLIGILIIVAWGLPEILANWRYKTKVLSILAGILVPALMVTTWLQVGHWKNSITLFKHAISVTDNRYPNLALAHNNLGIALEGKGRISEAMIHYKTAMKIKPDFALPHNNLGNIMFSMLETNEAISYYQTAIKLNPDYAMAHNNLGIALEEKGNFKEAIDHYKKAVRLKPKLVLAHYNLGAVLKQEGDFEGAVEHYREAIKFKPDFALAHNNLGNTLLAMRHTEEAIFHYRLAIKIDPQLTLAHNNLKIALLQSNE